MLGVAAHPARLSVQNSPPAENPATAKDRQGEARRIFQEGQAALNGGELDHAEAAFLKVLKLDRKSAAAHANLGVVEMRRKNWERALIELHAAQALAPQMTGIRVNIGLVEYRRANYEAAIPPF